MKIIFIVILYMFFKVCTCAISSSGTVTCIYPKNVFETLCLQPAILLNTDAALYPPLVWKGIKTQQYEQAGTREKRFRLVAVSDLVSCGITALCDVTRTWLTEPAKSFDLTQLV